MAYTSVSSLYHTIRLLLESSPTSVASSTEKILKSAMAAAKRLQQTLEKYDEIKSSSPGLMDVEARIRDDARNLEDKIESHASAQFQIHGNGSLSLNLDLDHLRNDIYCFVKTSKKMETEYLEELYKPAPPEEEAAAAALSISPPTDMVGFADDFLKIRDFIAGDETPRLIKLAITGMAGIGKTTFVHKLFHDSLLKQKFLHRAFVRVGQKYQFAEILRSIIAQLDDVDCDGMIVEGDDENVRRFFCGIKFLIVLDDVWDDSFERRFKSILPINCDGSCILVTSRITKTIEDGHHMRFMNEEESWELLWRKVFGELEECPSQFVKSGKKIAEKCEGLPLLIVTVADLLSRAPKKAEYWKEVADMKNSIFEDAIDQIYELLLPSYHYLDQASKACFLYMGVFAKDYVVRRSRIISLWQAEGFSGARFRLIDNVIYLLEDLVANNVIVVRQLSLSGMETKAFKFHLVFWHVCKREGENSKFLRILNSYDADGSIEQMKDNRYLAIYHNTLLALKEVHDSIATISSLRSVLCTGPYHQYQVPICLELKLLRVLDAATIRFYEFPVEAVKLIQLRYLSLTTNANLPPSIKKLWFLQFLIVDQHMSIINRSSVAESSYVPVEIWELKELVHLQIIGRNLPHPPPATILPNLRRLLDVGVQTCDKEVFESIPNLEKLRIQIESAPDLDDQTMSWCDHVSSLQTLTSLGSVVKNPQLFPNPPIPPRLSSISISSLQKLSLSGFGYPWEDMSMIAELPFLQQLKLHCYAFRGEKWEAKGKRCRGLMDLLIEDTDLVQWSAIDGTFPNLCQLTMKNCHKLKEIPLLESLLKIELVDCNPLAETCVKQNLECELQVSCSWK